MTRHFEFPDHHQNIGNFATIIFRDSDSLVNSFADALRAPKEFLAVVMGGRLEGGTGRNSRIREEPYARFDD